LSFQISKLKVRSKLRGIEPGAIKILDDLRKQGGLKGADVANFAQVSPATVSRWGKGQAFPHPKTQIFMSDLRYLVDRLSDFYTPEEARLWLYSKHSMLDGARAIELIRLGETERVLEVIEQLDAGVYL
jgi:transcriptional regulator with XRE-family HTH domain